MAVSSRHAVCVIAVGLDRTVGASLGLFNLIVLGAAGALLSSPKAASREMREVSRLAFFAGASAVPFAEAGLIRMVLGFCGPFSVEDAASKGILEVSFFVPACGIPTATPGFVDIDTFNVQSNKELGDFLSLDQKQCIENDKMNVVFCGSYIFHNDIV